VRPPEAPELTHQPVYCSPIIPVRTLIASSSPLKAQARCEHRDATNLTIPTPLHHGSFVQRETILFASAPGTHMTTTFAPAGPVLWRILSGGFT
jgi:hypothetical protein